MNGIERLSLHVLIELARFRWGQISPCDGKEWRDCMTTLPNGHKALWFNTADQSTHMYVL